MYVIRLEAIRNPSAVSQIVFSIQIRHTLRNHTHTLYIHASAKRSTTTSHSRCAVRCVPWWWQDDRIKSNEKCCRCPCRCYLGSDIMPIQCQSVSLVAIVVVVAAGVTQHEMLKQSFLRTILTFLVGYLVHTISYNDTHIYNYCGDCGVANAKCNRTPVWYLVVSSPPLSLSLSPFVFVHIFARSSRNKTAGKWKYMCAKRNIFMNVWEVWMNSGFIAHSMHCTLVSFRKHFAVHHTVPYIHTHTPYRKDIVLHSTSEMTARVAIAPVDLSYLNFSTLTFCIIGEPSGGLAAAVAAVAATEGDRLEWSIRSCSLLIYVMKHQNIHYIIM